MRPTLLNFTSEKTNMKIDCNMYAVSKSANTSGNGTTSNIVNGMDGTVTVEGSSSKLVDAPPPLSL